MYQSVDRRVNTITASTSQFSNPGECSDRRDARITQYITALN